MTVFLINFYGIFTGSVVGFLLLFIRGNFFYLIIVFLFFEVDDNVTRHLDSVLKREDWDLLILHYLGLDHIGHMTGPNSPLVGPKLREMDNILKKIHISLLSKVIQLPLESVSVSCGLTIKCFLVVVGSFFIPRLNCVFSSWPSWAIS